jgi:diguanylate cyclase (GGDEF)-like protein
MAREDLDIARLLRVSSTVRRMTEALVMAHDLPELAKIAQRVLPDLLPIDSIEVFASTTDEGILRFAGDNGFVGINAPIPDPSPTSLVLPVLGDGPVATVHITLTSPTDITPEMTAMFLRLAPALRVALNRHLEQRQLQHEHTELIESASRDPLTGLYNRAALEELSRVEAGYGVLMIDIDHFKLVNDVHGHPVGDRVLRDVAGACRGALRATDRLFRYGGEEMLGLIDSVDRAEIAIAAVRLRVAVEALTFADVPGLDTVTVSVGAAMHQQGQTVGGSIQDADRCLYVAKRGGRNRVVVDWEA